MDWILRGMLCLMAIVPVPAATAVIPLEKDYLVRLWRREEGLPDNRVLSLLCSRDGTVWVGTRRGVTRFDSARFVNWEPGTGSMGSSPECTALAQGLDGTVWVGTPAGLFALSPAMQQADLQEIRAAPAIPEIQNAVRSLLCTQTGDVVVGTDRGVFSRGRHGRWQVVQAPDGADRAEGLALMESSGARGAWASAGWRLLRRPAGSQDWHCVFDNNKVGDGLHVGALASLPGHDCVAIREDWSDTSGRLATFRDGGWSLLLDRPLRNGAYRLYLAADSRQQLWFPLSETILGCWRAGIVAEYRLPSVLEGDRIGCVAEDTLGNLWVGTARSGLLCLQPRRIHVLNPADAGTDSRTAAFLETTTGDLWVGTERGLAVHRAGGWQSEAGLQPLESEAIRALGEDAQGGIWVGTRNGLHRWDGRRLEAVVYAGEPYRTKVRTIHRGRDGAIWLGTAQGLYRFAAGSTHRWLVQDGLPHENVTAILEDRQGSVWVGTGGGGLARWKGGRLDCFSTKDGLSSPNVWVLHEDSFGDLWAGTDRGLNLWRDGHFVAITTTQGLPDNLVNGLAEDRHRQFWVGHDRGIYRVDRQALVDAAEGRRPSVTCITYSESDGLISPETNGQISAPSAGRLRDGRIGFATMAGVAILDPENLPDLTNGPPIRIEDVRAGAARLNGLTGITAPSEASPGPGTMRVPATRRGMVEIRYVAQDFGAPGHVRFRHRLRGLSDQWVDGGTSRQATFTGLKPGRYTFEVLAGNRQGYWNPIAASVELWLEPHWHERTSVRVGAIAALGLACALAIRWRVTELRRRHSLEQRVALAEERSRLARDLHDGLGAALTEISLLSHVDPTRLRLSPDATKRFERLSRTAQQAMSTVRELIWVTHPNADVLSSLVSRIQDTATRVFEAADVQGTIQVPPDIPPIRIQPEWRRDLMLAASEVLNNAIRHAEATEIGVVFAFPEGEIVLTIADNGRGISLPANVEPPNGNGTGLGLTSLRERLAAHSGKVRVESEPGRGTRVVLCLPLPPQAP